MLVTGLFSAFLGDMVAAVFVFLQFSVHQESNSYLNELKCYNLHDTSYSKEMDAWILCTIFKRSLKWSSVFTVVLL